MQDISTILEHLHVPGKAMYYDQIKIKELNIIAYMFLKFTDQQEGQARVPMVTEA